MAILLGTATNFYLDSISHFEIRFPPPDRILPYNNSQYSKLYILAPILSPKMTLETIVDNLRDGYNQLKPGTFLHADQLMAEQVKDAGLRTKGFYVADGPLYSLEGKKKTPTLWLTREPDNLVLRHLNDGVDSSYDQLVKTGNFRPDPKEARKARRAKGTLRIDLTKLRLQGDEAEWRYVEVRTTDYDSLNSEERKLAERWYGQGKAFGTAMKTLKDAGISATRVYVLNLGYVSREAKKGPVGRAAWRDYFSNYAESYAFGRGVGKRSGVRGVRLVSRKAAAPEVPPAPQEIKLATFDEVKAYSARFVPDVAREGFEAGLRNLYKP